MQQLGAGDFKVRERTEQLLAEMGEKALPVLKKNTGSDDPEISLRVKRLLCKVGCRERKALFAGKKRFKGFGEEGDKSRTWPCVMDVKEFNEETGKFNLGEPAAVTQVYQLFLGKCSGALGREGPFAEKRDGAVDDLAMLYRGDRNAAAEMRDNKTGLVERKAHGFGSLSRGCAYA